MGVDDILLDGDRVKLLVGKRDGIDDELPNGVLTSYVWETRMVPMFKLSYAWEPRKVYPMEIRPGLKWCR